MPYHVSPPIAGAAQEPKSLPHLSSHPSEDPYFNLQAKFFETRVALKEARKKSREQSRKGRQLVAVVAAKIEEKDQEMEKAGYQIDEFHFAFQSGANDCSLFCISFFQLRASHNVELSTICQQLLTLQSSMSREKDRVQRIMDEKDRTITDQRSEIDRLNLLISGSGGTANKTNAVPIPLQTNTIIVGDGGSGNGSSAFLSLGSAPPSMAAAPTLIPGRTHGSFRQYKREQKSQRLTGQSATASSSSSAIKSKSSAFPPPSSPSSSDLGSLGSTSLSSEENSSPNTTPKKFRPALRLSLSAGAATIPPAPPLPPNTAVGGHTRARGSGTGSSFSSSGSMSFSNLSYPRKGILKSSSSYGSLDSRAAASMLENLHKLIDINRNPQMLPDARKSSSEEKSDSGRESEETDESTKKRSTPSAPVTVNKMKVPTPPPIPPKKPTTVNGSEDSRICLTSSTTRLSIRSKEKPKPPPRSSTTRLTSSMRRPNSLPPMVPAVTSKEMMGDGGNGGGNTTVVTISGASSSCVAAVGDEEKKKAVKKVKFSPDVGKAACEDALEKKAIKLLEESILNFNPAQQKKRQLEKMKRIQQEEAAAEKGRKIEDCVSYYEPYI